VLSVHVLPPVQPPQLTSSPHEFFTVPHLPEQTAGGAGAAHFVQFFSVPPQPSDTPPPGSHTPGLEHVSGVQPHVCVVVLHAALVHWLVPQSTVTPHPVSVPHLSAQSAVVGGTQAVHWFVFASQICVAPPSSDVGHEPHSTVTPHESIRAPHSAPAALHAGTVDSQVCVFVLQVSEGGQPPQLTGPPQSLTVPQAFAPIAAQMPGTQPSPLTAPSGRNSGPESAAPPPGPEPLPGPAPPPSSEPPPSSFEPVGEPSPSLPAPPSSPFEGEPPIEVQQP